MSIDVKALGKVAVLMGGSSAERPISLMSGTGVLAALQSQGVDAHAFDPAERELFELKREGFARCFVALHGRFGEDGAVQGALELMRVPYTDATPAAHSSLTVTAPARQTITSQSARRVAMSSMKGRTSAAIWARS